MVDPDVRKSIREGSTRHLSEVLLEVLQAIRWYKLTHGYAPIIRELVSLRGMSSTNAVHEPLERLRHLGLVTWVPYRARTLQLTATGERICAKDEVQRRRSVEATEEDPTLSARIPGAVLLEQHETAHVERWAVVRFATGPRAATTLATGGSRREAIDRALFLWGSR